MIELPEALNIAAQINEAMRGKRIAGVVAGHTPHKLAWYYGEPAKYAGLLVGRTVGQARGRGSMVEIDAEDATILLGEGVAIRFHRSGETVPKRHQLLIGFDDGSALSGAVQMYGGMGAFPEGDLDNAYYRMAKDRVSPLSPAFDIAYFTGMASAQNAQKLSLKGLLATEQRIPGVGNGVLQDILFRAGMHPKRKVSSLSGHEMAALLDSMKATLSAMTAAGGRDTEVDLFGRPGGYVTKMSKKTANQSCPACGSKIKKEAYMGGSVYYCEKCQKL